LAREGILTPGEEISLPLLLQLLKKASPQPRTYQRARHKAGRTDIVIHSSFFNKMTSPVSVPPSFLADLVDVLSLATYNDISPRIADDLRPLAADIGYRAGNSLSNFRTAGPRDAHRRVLDGVREKFGENLRSFVESESVQEFLDMERDH